MKDLILQSVEDAIRAANYLKHPTSLAFIEKGALLLADVYRKGNKVLIAGNGGSLCDAMHFAEELTGQFRQKREALAAIALSDPSHITCVGNDFGFDSIFSRSIEALGKEGDLFVALSTSGNSLNILSAIEQAKRQNLYVMTFLGKTGGKMKGLGDLEWIVPGFSYSDRIQEAHMAVIHIMIESLEQLLFSYAAR